MNRQRQMKVLLAPQVSEKATQVAEAHNQHVFQVMRDATKNEIKTAVEQLFKVKVTAVRTLNTQGKAKRFGAHYGRRMDWKKAYVSLAAGDDIDFAGGE